MSRWSEPDVGFRPLTVGDLPLLYDWLGREHVRRWWGTRAAYDEAVAEYLDAIEGRDPTDLYVIVVAGEDVGLIQTYLLADYPDYAALIGAGDEAAGLDVFLGDAGLTGSGLGTYVIRTFASEVVFARAETRALRRRPRRPQPRLDPRVREGRLHAAVATFVDPEDDELHAVMRLERPSSGAQRRARADTRRVRGERLADSDGRQEHGRAERDRDEARGGADGGDAEIRAHPRAGERERSCRADGHAGQSSTAPNAIPADNAVLESTPCEPSASATAALASPTFPGVIGRTAASSTAGTRTSAARSGLSIPIDATTAVAAATFAAAPASAQPETIARSRGDEASDLKAARSCSTRPGSETCRETTAIAPAPSDDGGDHEERPAAAARRRRFRLRSGRRARRPG